MVCSLNQLPAQQLRPSRWRLTQSTTGVVAIAWECPAEVQIEQITIHWSSAPVAAAACTLKRDSIDGPTYDTLLESVDPSVEPLTDLACLRNWRFSKGDYIKLDYSNPNSRTVGVTIWVVQVDN